MVSATLISCRLRSIAKSATSYFQWLISNITTSLLTRQHFSSRNSDIFRTGFIDDERGCYRYMHSIYIFVLHPLNSTGSIPQLNKFQNLNWPNNCIHITLILYVVFLYVGNLVCVSMSLSVLIVSTCWQSLKIVACVCVDIELLS